MGWPFCTAMCRTTLWTIDDFRRTVFDKCVGLAHRIPLSVTLISAKVTKSWGMGKRNESRFGAKR